ncbi:MAG: Ig-like domain repeat protein [Candidatus Riflebacteria bacterium]|nr:Ig-like domain repeat protein [Candidatus Riflebacteria bacterium]
MISRAGAGLTWMVALTLLVVATAACAADKQLVDLEVADALARPGELVELRAKLESNSTLGEDIEGATISFLLDGEPVGTGVTNDDGVASVRVTAPARGDHVVKALFEGDAENLRGEYNALLCVRTPEDPLMILDIDWTISMTDNVNTAVGSSDSPPLKFAPEVVARLAKTYTPVYVTARARQLRKRTLSWLHRYAFPPGPSFFLNPKEYPTFDEAKYKAKILVPMAKAFPKLHFGFGNKESDRDAYKEAGLAAVLVTGREIPGAVCVRHWLAAEEAIDRLPARK